MPSVFAALTLHTLSSSSEAFPNVLGEAMACGVPCVATDVGNSSFLIGDTGLVVSPKDPALADAWERILNLGSEDRSTLGERAREHIQQLFSIVQITRRYEDLYEQVFGGCQLTCVRRGNGWALEVNGYNRPYVRYYRLFRSFL